MLAWYIIPTTETTFAFDLSCIDECENAVDALYAKLLPRLENHQHRIINKQGIKLKFSDFTQTTVEQQSTHCDEKLFKTLLAKALLRSNTRDIRLIGLTLGFSDEKAKENKQLSFAL